MTNEEATGQQFLDLIRELEGGGFMLDAETALLEVIAAVQHTGNKGRVTIALDIQGDPHEAAIYVNAAINPKMPALPERRHSLFYHVDGRISRRDPRQPSLPMFGAVDRTTGEISEAEPGGDAAGEGVAQ